jgi:hypothetical protein
MAGEQEKARTLIDRALALDPANDAIRQNAGMVRATRNAILPGDTADENRPSLERTGLFEITLTIPPSING